MLRCRQTTLPNGIIVVTDTAGQFQSAALSVSFRAGSVHEPEHLAGITHFLEHMVFRDTQPGGLMQSFTRFGGYLNALTTHDSTEFQAVVVGEDLHQAISLIAEHVINPRFDAAAVDLERDVITQEAATTHVLRDAFYAEAFPGQALGRPVIGYCDTVSGLSHSDLLAHHARSYVARNLVIAVAGKVNHEALVAHVAELFENMPEGLPTRAPQSHLHAGQVLMPSRPDHARVRLGYKLPMGDNRSMDALTFFNAMLGAQGETALMRSLRSERGLVYDAWSDMVVHAGTGIFFIEVAGAASDMADILCVTSDCMQEVARYSQEHAINLEKCRFQQDERIMLDSLSARVGRLGAQINQFGTLIDEADRIRSYLNMESHQIARAASDMLDKEPAIVASGPPARMPQFSEMRTALSHGSSRKAPLLRHMN